MLLPKTYRWEGAEVKNKTSITVWKKSFGEYYYVEKDVSDFTFSELYGVLNMMDCELGEKIKIENARKPKLPR
jgi:hypothetical protein